MVEAVLNDFWQIDIVVNNAAINKQRPIEDLSLEAVPTRFRTRISSLVHGCYVEPWPVTSKSNAMEE